MSFVITIKNSGKVHKIEVPENASGLDLKKCIQERTQIPVARQKIIIKGGKLADDVLIRTLQLNLKTPLMVLGTPDKDLPSQNLVKKVFIEDMSGSDASVTSQDPSGLMNLGNTCYFNSSLQAIYSMDDIAERIKSYSGNTNALANSLKATFNLMAGKQQDVVPSLSLVQFRKAFPQFNEQEMGVYKQQDAEEAFSQLLRNLNTDLKLEGLMDVTYKVQTHDPLSDEIATTTETSNKVNCYIDIKTNFLRDGLLNGLKDTIEKYNETAQANVEHQVTKTITRLPKYLTVHFVRFFWRKDTKKKSKILRKVLFPFDLDVAELLDDSIKGEKIQVRDDLMKIEKNHQENIKEFLKTKKDNSLTPDQQREQENAQILSIKTKFRDDFQGILPQDLNLDTCTENPSTLYELTSLITHQGVSADSGHYQAFVRDPNDLTGESWWRFNDNKVLNVSRDRIEALAGGGESDSALVLIYKAKGI